MNFFYLLRSDLITSHTCKLYCIRPYLASKKASTITVSIVHSKLDYCNSLSLYYNLPQKSRINHLQYCLALLVLFSCILFCLLLLGCL